MYLKEVKGTDFSADNGIENLHKLIETSYSIIRSLEKKITQVDLEEWDFEKTIIRRYVLALGSDLEWLTRTKFANHERYSETSDLVQKFIDAFKY